MRAALIQTGLDPAGRSSNMQAISAAIRRAARVSPAPDLLVLPGACDTGGVSPARNSPFHAMQSTRDLIAMKAKEWGVYIAVGLRDRDGDGFVSASVLFDPDGDVAAQSRHPIGEDPSSPGACPVWSTPLGRIGVVHIDQLLESDRIEDGSFAGAWMALPLAPGSWGRRRRAIEERVLRMRDDAALRKGAFWGVVVPARDSTEVDGTTELTTFACGPQGDPLAIARSHDEAIVFVEASLEVATTTIGGSRDDDAD